MAKEKNPVRLLPSTRKLLAETAKRLGISEEEVVQRGVQDLLEALKNPQERSRIFREVKKQRESQKN